MKNSRYTQKQIQEAIAHWTAVLESMDSETPFQQAAPKLETVIKECLRVYKRTLNESSHDEDDDEQAADLSKLAKAACSSKENLSKLVQKNDAFVQKKGKTLKGKAKKLVLKAWNAIKAVAAGTSSVFKFLKKYWLPILLVAVFFACKYGFVKIKILSIIDWVLQKIMNLAGFKGYSPSETAALVNVSGNASEGIGKEAVKELQKYNKIPGGFYDQGTF